MCKRIIFRSIIRFEIREYYLFKIFLIKNSCKCLLFIYRSIFN